MTKIGETDLQATLDGLDRKILNAVQSDNQRSHASIGEDIGLSSSAVRRRLSALRQSGVIAQDVSILAQTGLGVRLIVTVSFGEESVEAYEAFDRQIAETKEIQQAYHVAGSDDYVLIVHGPSLEWYEDWAKSAFMSNAAIRRYDTTVVWSCKKFDTRIDL